MVEVEPEPEPQATRPTVLVTTEAIGTGTLLTDEHLEWREFEVQERLGDVMVEGAVPLRAVVGAIAIRPLDAGAPVTWSSLLVPDHPGYISAVLGPDMVAMTIDADASTNIIYPGDRVDVILVTSHTGSVASSTVVRASRVLAVGTSVYSMAHYGRTNVTEGIEVDPPPLPSSNAYTLELTARNAERIAVAASIGTLTLAVRPTFRRRRGRGLESRPDTSRSGDAAAAGGRGAQRARDSRRRCRAGSGAKPVRARVASAPWRARRQFAARAAGLRTRIRSRLRLGANARPCGRVGSSLRELLAFSSLAVVAALGGESTGAAELVDEPDMLDLAPGMSTTIAVERTIDTAFVANPATADVNVLDERTLFVLGREPGVTTLRIHGETGDLLAHYTVRVQLQTAYAQAIVERIAGEERDIEVVPVGNALFVSGQADDPAQAERLLRGIRGGGR